MTASQDLGRETDSTASKPYARPMTGAGYLESIDDDRVIYIYGERVKKTTEHPAFRNSARMLARLYDALHDPARSGELLVPTDAGNGGVTQAYFRAPRNAEEALAGRNAIAAWQRFASKSCTCNASFRVWRGWFRSLLSDNCPVPTINLSVTIQAASRTYS